MSASAHGHQSNYQGQTTVLRHEDDIEKRIQARIAKDGIRIKEFFLDFDKLRKGTVGEAAFRTCIGTLGVELSEAETTELANRYKTNNGSGHINYRDFVNKLDDVFLEHMNPSDVIQNARTSAVFNDADKESMIEMMTALHTHVVSNRIHLKPGF